MTIRLTVDGRQVDVERDRASLLEVLRDELGLRSAKDGCSPQGQCGCCTVLVDGQPRVACVTPVRRVAGREITTLDGFDEPTRQTWGEAFCATGASQCGFCTPGIVVRLEGLRGKGAEVDDHAAVDRALAAHLCRCTGWRTIHEAWELAVPALSGDGAATTPPWPGSRDVEAAERRAELERLITDDHVTSPPPAAGEAAGAAVDVAAVAGAAAARAGSVATAASALAA